MKKLFILMTCLFLSHFSFATNEPHHVQQARAALLKIAAEKAANQQKIEELKDALYWLKRKDEDLYRAKREPEAVIAKYNQMIESQRIAKIDAENEMIRQKQKSM